MDQRRALIPRFAALLLGGAAVGLAAAHPHKDIDQQVLVSVGTGEVIVQIRIAPSFTDGAAIFAHIDTDGDGAVSESEAAAFGADVIADALLKVDGRNFDFSAPRVSVPELEWVSAGLGLIEVDATAAVNLTAVAPHRVDFEISYNDLAHEWFIQPFYYPELLSALPTQSIERSESRSRVRIALAP
jgi:hypothetical protein